MGGYIYTYMYIQTYMYMYMYIQVHTYMYMVRFPQQISSEVLVK